MFDMSEKSSVSNNPLEDAHPEPEDDEEEAPVVFKEDGITAAASASTPAPPPPDRGAGAIACVIGASCLLFVSFGWITCELLTPVHFADRADARDNSNWRVPGLLPSQSAEKLLA